MKSMLSGKFVKFILLSLMVTISVMVYADPPSRVARISIMEGDVSILPTGETEWIYAVVNRPLTTGDKLWADTSARSELEFGGAALRTGANTDIAILNIDNKTAQFALNEGSIVLHVWNIKPEQIIEIDTPNLSFTTNQPGDYRINVNVEGDATVISMKSGQGTVYGEGATFELEPQQAYTFTGTNINELQVASLLSDDELDQWSASLDSKRLAAKASAKYVSDDVIGSSDLEAHGQWQLTQDYGNVWYPSNVSSDWAPYRDGSWIWQEPWGWTWVDDQSWGFAPFHYGRWVFVDDRWGWLPPVEAFPVYAPALVAFIGGDGFGVSVSVGGFGDDIGWFPLGPSDLYFPPYVVSQNYFTYINVTNININPIYVNKFYRNRHGYNYHHWKSHRGWTVVPRGAFRRGERVQRVRVPVTDNMIRRGRIKDKPNIVPGAGSRVGASRPARVRPPREVRDRRVLIKNPLPADRGLRQPGQRPRLDDQTQRIRNISPVRPVRDRGAVGVPQDQLRPRRDLQVPQPQDRRDLRPIQRRDELIDQRNRMTPEMRQQRLQEIQQRRLQQQQQRLQQSPEERQMRLQQQQERLQRLQQQRLQQQRTQPVREQNQQLIEQRQQERLLQQRQRQQMIQQRREELMRQRQQQQMMQPRRDEQQLQQQRQRQQIIQQQRQQQQQMQQRQQQQMYQQQRQQQIQQQRQQMMQQQRQQQIQQQRQQMMQQQRQQQIQQQRQEMMQQQRQQQIQQQRQQQIQQQRQQMMQQQRQQQIQQQRQQMIQQQRQQQQINQQRRQQQQFNQQQRQEIIQQQRERQERRGLYNQ